MQEQFQQLWSAVCSGEAPADALCDWLQEYVTAPKYLRAVHHFSWAEPDPFSIEIDVSSSIRGGWDILLLSPYWGLRARWNVTDFKRTADLLAKKIQEIDTRHRVQRRAYRLT